MPEKSVIAKRKVCNMTPEVKERIAQIQNGNVPAEYKHTKAGIYPEDWVEVTLGDIYTERKEPGNESLPLLMVSIHSGVSDGEVDEEDLPKKVKRIEDKSQYKRAAVGDLVFNMMRAWQGAIGSVRTEGMVSPAYIVAEPNDMVDPLFMDYYMKTNRMVHTIHQQSYGVTDFRLRLYWDSFAPICCVLPCGREQKKIAETLTVQEKIIELKENLLAEKQRQKKYLMQQLLTGKKRLPGFDGEWIFVCANTIFKNVTDKKHDGRLEVLSATQDRGIIPRSQVDIDIKYAEESLPGYKKVVKGNFVISLRSFQGGVEYSEYTGIVSPAYTVLSSIYPIEDNYYKQYFKSTDYINRLNVAVYGIRDGKQISYDDFGRIKIPYPPLGEQRAIATVLSTADREIELLSKDIEQEKKKKKALMQLLLTGIVRV